MKHGCELLTIQLNAHRTNTSLMREIDMMRKGSSPYVLQVLGVFMGQVPSSSLSAQLGLVMENMERGSLVSLQVELKSYMLNMTSV